MNNDTTTIETTPKQQIEAWAIRHGVTMRAEFVPLSQSRNKDEKSPTLNWKVTLRKVNPRFEASPAFLTTDYSAGCAHCPAYKLSVRECGGQNSMMRHEAIRMECENGKAIQMYGETPRLTTNHILPDLADVLYSLSMDADVLNSGSFENWASEYGYDTDSRKAESIYRACLDIALKMRAALGDSALQELRDACQDY